MIEEIYTNEIQPLGLIYDYKIYWINSTFMVEEYLIQNLNETDCKQFMQTIEERSDFACWVIDSFCMSNLPHPINSN
jgi:hypothetical protein